MKFLLIYLSCCKIWRSMSCKVCQLRSRRCSPSVSFGERKIWKVWFDSPAAIFLSEESTMKPSFAVSMVADWPRAAVEGLKGTVRMNVMLRNVEDQLTLVYHSKNSEICWPSHVSGWSDLSPTWVWSWLLPGHLLCCFALGHQVWNWQIRREEPQGWSHLSLASSQPLRTKIVVLRRIRIIEGATSFLHILSEERVPNDFLQISILHK